MKLTTWISGLLLFVVSIGMAIAFSHLTASYSPLATDLNYSQTPTSAAASPVQFPSTYKQQFVHYATVDCPNSGIVRQMYIDRPSLESLKTSEAVPSGAVIVMETHSARRGDGDRLVPTQLNNLFVREKQQGWNVADSGEWQSAWYDPSGSLVSDNQSSCISCHTSSIADRVGWVRLSRSSTCSRLGAEFPLSLQLNLQSVDLALYFCASPLEDF